MYPTLFFGTSRQWRKGVRFVCHALSFIYHMMLGGVQVPCDQPNVLSLYFLVTPSQHDITVERNCDEIFSLPACPLSQLSQDIFKSGARHWPFHPQVGSEGTGRNCLDKGILSWIFLTQLMCTIGPLSTLSNKRTEQQTCSQQPYTDWQLPWTFKLFIQSSQYTSPDNNRRT